MTCNYGVLKQSENSMRFPCVAVFVNDVEALDTWGREGVKVQGMFPALVVGLPGEDLRWLQNKAT